MQVDRIIEVSWDDSSCSLYIVNCLQAAAADQELKARTVHINTFVMWPLNEKGKLRKASTDAMKLNKEAAIW